MIIITTLTSILNTIKSLNLGSVVTNTNNTLKTIKKAIPVYKEIRPYFRKEKTLFKKEELFNTENDKEKESEYINNDTLTFFH